MMTTPTLYRQPETTVSNVENANDTRIEESIVIEHEIFYQRSNNIMENDSTSTEPSNIELDGATNAPTTQQSEAASVFDETGLVATVVVVPNDADAEASTDVTTQGNSA